MAKQKPPRNLQRGMVLILLVFMLGIAATAYLIQSLNSNTVRIEQDKQTAALLAQAKTALMGYAIGTIGGSQRPGDLIRPDANSESSANYDGSAESGCMDFSKTNGLPLISTGSNMRCLGRLPWKDLGLQINNPSENDATGEMPWYAVSANLVDSICLTTLNSEILNLINTSFLCAGTVLPYPWLTVRDRLGNILSSEVAAVIFIPGLPTSSQSRPASPLSGAGQYLDSITVTDSAECTATHIPGTYNNAALNNDFIMADDTRTVSENDPCFQHPYQFNDKLIYITIDELMEAVEKRAAQEAVAALRNYYTASNVTPANRFYPYAANLNDTNNACVSNALVGRVPIAPASATCTSGTSCSASFPMTKVTFNLDTGLYTSKTGACSRFGNMCTCTGAGSCIKSGGAATFTCDSTGACASTGTNPTGTFEFTYTPQATDATTTTGACLGNGGTVSCSNAGSFSSYATTCTHSNPGLATLPSWFTDNRWQDFMYYTISNDCTSGTPGCATGQLTVGTRGNIHAMIISSGKTLLETTARPGIAQSRPSSHIEDYLDSQVNISNSSTYDAVGQSRSSTYNDQMFIVAP